MVGYHTTRARLALEDTLLELVLLLHATLVTSGKDGKLGHARQMDSGTENKQDAVKCFLLFNFYICHSVADPGGEGAMAPWSC